MSLRMRWRLRPKRGGDTLSRVIDTMREVDKHRGAYVVDKRILSAFEELKNALRARGNVIP